MKLLRASYKAFLREAKQLSHQDRGIRFFDPPSLNSIVKQYGRGGLTLPPSVPSLQASLFPGVDFSAYPGQDTLTGQQLAALVRASFRSAGGSGDGLQHLPTLNLLRTQGETSSVALTEVGQAIRVRIECCTLFLPNLEVEAMAASSRYTFGYRLRMHNLGTAPVQVLGRHWHFVDSKGGLMEVPRGSPGVVGHSPRIEPGQVFQYMSGVSLATPTGSMEGSFQATAHDGQTLFDCKVARTELRCPA